VTVQPDGEFTIDGVDRNLDQEDLGWETTSEGEVGGVPGRESLIEAPSCRGKDIYLEELNNRLNDTRAESVSQYHAPPESVREEAMCGVSSNDGAHGSLF
jgi:hypothetical protein